MIGGGAAALCAAIAARRAGASVLLLEQAPTWLRGGNTRHSRNLRIAHAAPTPLTTGRYPAAEFYADIARATADTADPDLTRLLVEHSREIVGWLRGAGVHFQPTASGVLPPSRKTVFLLGGGKAMLNALYRTALHSGVVIRYGCEVQSLQQPLHLAPDAPMQVGYCQDGVRGWLRPRTAIACCGGAQANRAWLRTQWGAAADGFINRGTPFASGLVLEGLLRAGACAVGSASDAYLVAVDARSPADDGGIATRVRGMPAGIVVDRTGQRFEDEGGDTGSTRYAFWGRRLARCPGQIAWLLLDARGLASLPPTLYPAIRAARIGDLARRLGLPAAPLAQTLDRYNAAVRPPASGTEAAGWHSIGLDPPKSRQALPLTEPPFAAYPMRPGITFTYRGVGVDASMRVRRACGGSIPHLFAAGMMMAPNILPRGYISGLALTIGVVSGRLAGTQAACHVWA